MTRITKFRMAPDKPLAVTYTLRMNNQSYGYGRFNPVCSRELQPGYFGFFDSMGSWNPIRNLSDTPSLERHGFKEPVDELDKAPSEVTIQWAPKISGNVPGLRVGASGHLE
jgi:hypothetical protein